LLFSWLFAKAQDKPIDLQPKDTLVYQETYGLRLGIDLSRSTITFFEPEYSGFEIVGDYRITQSLYLAAELGTEKRDRQEDLYNFTTSGNYLKVGIDYNTYGNWYGEQNLIYIGGRLAYSNFSQTLNNYQIFDSNRYWYPDGFATGFSEVREFNGLSAIWLEFVLGIKAELFANIYLGGSVRLAAYVKNDEPENFSNLFIPGFNKVTDAAIFGIGYNFSLSYFIPLYKKARVNKKKKTAPPPLEENQQ
jgi:hypothetical protein